MRCLPILLAVLACALPARGGVPEAQALLADADAQFRIAQTLGADPQAGAAEALKWLRHAADQGHIGAQLHLAIALEEGRGTARDAAEAAPWYAKAGAAGDAEALYRLALLHDEGAGVPRDTLKARDLLGRAADLGHARARERLARLLGPSFPQLDAGDPFKGLR